MGVYHTSNVQFISSSLSRKAVVPYYGENLASSNLKTELSQARESIAYHILSACCTVEHSARSDELHSVLNTVSRSLIWCKVRSTQSVAVCLEADA